MEEQFVADVRIPKNHIYYIGGHQGDSVNMTEEIFRHDGYMFEFESTVLSVDGDFVELGSTAFYPGGGGQVCDTGTIRGNRVTDVMYKGKNIVHKVPGHDLKTGDVVWCTVDWDRRYDLMQGHTGEHLLFCALKRQDPELTITKIFISPESKYVIVNHDVDWSLVKEALKFANTAIRDCLPVTKSVMSRDDPELNEVRIKLDRIEEGEEISVVSIGDIDLSACSGIHVMETAELECLFVDRKVSAGKEGVAIHFKIGKAAIDSAMELANICLQAVDAADSKPELLTRTIDNIKHDLSVSTEIIRNASKQQLAQLKPEIIGDVKLYSGIFFTDRKTLSDTCERIKSEGGVAAIVSKAETLTVMLASGNDKVNCRDIISEVLGEFGGRGGGKADFAQGGVENVSKAEAVLERMTAVVKDSIF
jgi:alanyl-tRNA synthetase